MHVIGLIVSLLIGGFVWYRRYKMARGVLRDASDAIGTAKGAYNRKKFRTSASLSPLTSIDDPVLGAAILLVSLCEIKGPLGRADEDMISSLLSDVSGEGDLDELITHACWASREVPDTHQVIRRLLPLWNEKLTLLERGHLALMAKQIVTHRSMPIDAQTEALRRLRNGLGVRN